MKILYIEDTDSNIVAMRRIVQLFGHQLTVAVTGADGYALAKEHWHLICIDINLPDMNGLMLVRQLRAENLKVPIVAFTGDLWNYNRDIALAAGCNDLIEKPFTVGDIQSLLSRYGVSP